MRNWFVLFLVSLFSSAYSQEVINEYEIPDKHTFQDVELFSNGDSIIANMSLWFQGATQLKSYVLPPKGDLTALPTFRWTTRKDIIGSVPRPGGIKRMYYLNQEKKQFTILATDVNLEDRGWVHVPGNLVLEGKMLGMFTNKNEAVVFYYDKGTIHEIVLDGLTTSAKKSYALPPSMSEVNIRDVTLCADGEHIGALQAKSFVKIFVSDEWITAVHDHWGYGYKSVYTTVARCERSSGKVISRTIPTEGIISSTMLDTLLYRTKNSKSVFTLEVFGISSAKKIYEHKIESIPAHETQMVYLREGRANRIRKTESLKHMMHVMRFDTQFDPFVIAQHHGDSTLITWGNYVDDNGMQGPAGLDPVAGMILMVVGTTAKQIRPGPGLSRYFYLTGNIKDGFTFKDKPDCVRTRIDLFEMDQQKNVEAKKYGYFNFKGDIIAIYYLPKKDKLKFVKFRV